MTVRNWSSDGIQSQDQKRIHLGPARVDPVPDEPDDFATALLLSNVASTWRELVDHRFLTRVCHRGEARFETVPITTAFCVAAGSARRGAVHLRDAVLAKRVA